MSICFEVQVNDEKKVIAGARELNVLSATITFVSHQNDIAIQVGGLTSRGPHDNEHLEWMSRGLLVGDHIAIRVVELGKPSPPVRRERQDPADSEEMERRYYEQLKKKYEPA